MKIVMRDSRVLEGSPLEIVQQMQSLAFDRPEPLRDYMNWLVANALKFDGVKLAVGAADDEAMASALVNELLRGGLAHSPTGEHPDGSTAIESAEPR